MMMLATQIYDIDWLHEKWDSIKYFARKFFIGLVSYATLFICCHRFIDMTAATSLAIFLLLYGGAMTMCRIGEVKLVSYYRSGALTMKNLFRFSMLASAPIYLFWVPLSLIPVTSYGIWFITGFPVVVISMFTLGAVAEYWNKKSLFWLLQTSIYILCFIAGQCASRMMFL